jgi:hypothetical protein
MRRTARTLPLALAAACTLAAGTLAATGPKFYDDDPLRVEPITQDVTQATRYEPDLVYQTIENLFGTPGDRVTDQRAKNVNTVDEVPDGPSFVNRAGARKLTPAEVARASNTLDGPAAGTWEIISAKSDGVTPGFTIRDRDGINWFVKFDPPGWRGMATGSEMIGAKLFWALGYHTVEYYLADLRPDRLLVSPEARVSLPDGRERAMTSRDIAGLLARAERDPDGSYRVIMSRAAPGRPVGRIRFEGTRADDPNDLVPHEHRRELRGYRVFAAWLNHVDVKGINSIAVLLTENGRTFIRNYLLDFGSILGSAAVGPRQRWQGYERLVEPAGEIGRRTASLGFLVPRWRTVPLYESRAIGRLPRSHADWDPDAWQPHIGNAAFRHLRADDAFWAARILSSIDDDLIGAAVAEGRFGDPEAEAFLVRAIAERRDRILGRYLPAVNPVVEPVLAGGQLSFANAAVDAGVAVPPASYRAAWFTFDNATGDTRPLGDTTGTTSPLPAPALPDVPFIKVQVSAVHPTHATWATPVDIYFRQRGGQWMLVGLERLP